MIQEETTFCDVLHQLAEAEPDRPSLTLGDVTVSRQDLMTAAQRVAGLFARHGVGRGSFVTIGLPNSIELVQAIIACWWLGATPQPISNRLAPIERHAIIDLSEPALVVGVPTDEGGDRPVLTVDDLRGAAVDRAATAPPAITCSPCWKAVTSGGSTGRPKVIVAEQPAVYGTVSPVFPMFHLRAEGCVLVTGPLSHNAPLLVTTFGLLLGKHVVLMRKFDASETLRLAEQHRADWLYLVPTMMLRIWRLPATERDARDLSGLEVAFHMAAPCAPWLKRAWIDWLGPQTILELYGGTEGQAMTVVTGTEWLAHPGTVGRPVFGEIEARDPAGVVLPAGTTGELWMRRGPGERAPYRYVGAEARTADDSWESLGDIGYLDSDGYVYITDRQLDMIVVGGSNVYPAEIEAALDEYPAVRSSCVIGMPDDELGNVPHAIVELSEPASDDALLEHLRHRLAVYKLPRSIERVDRPLRDDAGKVRRTALRAERLNGPSDNGPSSDGPPQAVLPE